LINFAEMKKVPVILVVVMLCSAGIFAFADRGGITRKDKPQLNIELHGTLKNSIPFNLKSGIVFRGSEILSSERVGNSIVSESLVSYRKGNTIYLIPYKQRLVIPEYSNKGGYKIIIRSRK